MKTYDEVTEAIESALEGTGWSFEFWVDADGKTNWLLEAHSPAGEDLPIEGRCSDPETALEAIVNEVSDYADCYDPEEHAAELIPIRGTHGVPDSVHTLLDDAHAISEMYKELRDKLVALTKPDDGVAPAATPRVMVREIDFIPYKELTTEQKALVDSPIEYDRLMAAEERWGLDKLTGLDKKNQMVDNLAGIIVDITKAMDPYGIADDYATDEEFIEYIKTTALENPSAITNWLVEAHEDSASRGAPSVSNAGSNKSVPNPKAKKAATPAADAKTAGAAATARSTNQPSHAKARAKQ